MAARIRRLAPLVIVWVTVSMVALGGVADAQNASYAEPSSSIAVPANAITPVDVGCPSGDVITGGGYQVQNPSTVTVLASQPAFEGVLNDANWEVTVDNTASTSEQITVTAICLPSALPGYQLQTNSTSVPSGGSGFVSAQCAAGDEVLGGGFSAQAGLQLTTSLAATQSEEETDLWSAGASNSSTTTETLSAVAVCVQDTLAGYQELDSGDELIQPGATQTDAESCAAGSEALGGGYFVEIAAVQASSDQPASGGVISSNTWSAALTNTNSAARESAVMVICASPEPNLMSLSPASGPTAGGTSVTITGTALMGATAVDFGSTPASAFSVLSATQITATSPPGSAGTISLTVTTPFGTSSAGFTYVAAPPTVQPTMQPTPPTVQPTPPTVQPTPPTVQPAPPTVQSSSGAGFSGTVNPEGQATTAYFEYGLDPKYAGGGPVVYDETTPTQQVGSGVSAASVSASVAGLVPNALYHVRLVATNSAGTTTGPDQTFTTALSPPPPPPVLGKTENVTVVSGIVLIKLPGGRSADAPGDERDDALVKGEGFIPLTEARQIPSGSQIDARRGTLILIAAPPIKRGRPERVTLGGAIFTSTQSRTGLTKGLTTISLLEGAFLGAPSYASCPKPTAHNPSADNRSADNRTPDNRIPENATAQVAKASPKVLQTLKASDNHGQFRTKGRYSSASVIGTQWTTSDRCDGTLTTVQRGAVDVYDFATRKTILVHAGHSYLARALFRA